MKQAIACSLLILSLSVVANGQAKAQLLDRHPEPTNPADLSSDEAERIYLDFRPRLQAIFRNSGDKNAARYTRWQRFNSQPFLSATHGQRYINHYANSIAAEGYGTPGAVLPEGSIIAKDAITVLEDGQVFPGALAFMEKMFEGYDPDANDWRFTELLPDGTYIVPPDATSGESGFCIGCHQAAPEGQDLLFFVPVDFADKAANGG